MKNLTLFEQAIEYQKLGYSIIPLNSNKAPLVKWTIYQQQKASAQQIKRWFNSLDVLGIGIITGEISGLVVIDVDPQHGGSYSELEQFVTPTTKTGSGGRHFYFSPTDETDYETAHFSAQGYDILGNGAYAVAPQSLHPNGSKYEWIRSILETPLLPFPQEFKQQLKRAQPVIVVTRVTEIPQTEIEYKEGKIPDHVIDQLRALPIKQVIEGEGLLVPETSRHYSKIACPFHNDRDPSFSIRFDRNYAQCFSCHKRYNTIDFIREYRHLDFREACFYMMEKYGITNT